MKTDLLCSSCPRLTTLPFVFMALHLYKVKMNLSTLSLLFGDTPFCIPATTAMRRMWQVRDFHHCVTQLTWLKVYGAYST